MDRPQPASSEGRRYGTRIVYSSKVTDKEVKRMDVLVKKLNKIPEFQEFVDLHLKMKIRKMMVIDI